MIGKYHGKDVARIRVQESNTESSPGKINEAEGRNKRNAKPGLTKIRMEPKYGDVDFGSILISPVLICRVPIVLVSIFPGQLSPGVQLSGA